MGTIQEKLNLTLNNKNSIKSAIRSKGIEVTDEEPFSSYAQKIIDYKGIDTSDATATTGDIANGKTAYVNGEKIMGEVKFLANSEEEAEGMRIGNQGKVNLFESEDTTVVNIIEQTPERVAFEKDSFIATGVSYDKMSTAIGLTPDKLKFGEKVLNINGEFTSDATATAEDILRNKTAYVNGEKVVGVAGPSGIPDWSQIGYESTPTSILSDFNYSKEIYDNWDDTVTSLYLKFKNDTKLVYMPNVNTSKVRDMSSMFYGCSNLKNVPLLDTSNVVEMTYMFNKCTNLLEIPKFDMSNVTKITYMFNECSSLTSIANLDFSNVTDARYLFYNCKSLKNIPSILNFEKINSAQEIFRGCSSLENINVRLAPNISLNYTFEGCSSLENVTLETSTISSMDNTFGSCRKLKRISNIDTSNTTNMYCTFYFCDSLEEMQELNAQKVTQLSNIFSYCYNLTTIGGLTDLGKAYTQKSTNYNNYTLYLVDCKKLTHDSLMNVINKLYDLNLNTNLSVDGVCQYTQSLKIGSTNIAKLTEEEIAIATSKGWTVS